MKTVRFLFVDDMETRCRTMSSIVRTLNEKFEASIVLDIAMTPQEAIDMLTGPDDRYTVPGQPRYELLSLDHDMAQEHYEDLEATDHKGTGRDVSLFLKAQPDLCPKWVNVHSWNAARASDMQRDLIEMQNEQDDTGFWTITRQVFPEVGWLLDALEDVKSEAN